MEEDIQRLEEIIQNVKSNGRDLELWIHSNELPNDIKEEIISNMSHILEGNEEFDELAMKINRHLRKPYIKKFFLFHFLLLLLLLLLFHFIDRFKK